MKPSPSTTNTMTTPAPRRGAPTCRLCLLLAMNFALPPAGAEILPLDRRTVWQPGVTHQGGIPNRTTIHRTLVPSGGSDEAAIQNAIDTCPSNQVIQLGPGTFQLPGTGVGLWIQRSDITIRGAGPAKTRIQQTRPSDPLQDSPPVFVVGALWYYWVEQTPFAVDGVKGSRTVTLTGNLGLKVGELVHVSETYDASLTRYFHDVQTLGHVFLGWGEGQNQDGAGGSIDRSRPIGQAMEIEAVDGNRITFSTPFHMDFRTSHAAHVARIARGGETTGRQPVTRVGIENLSVGYGGGGDGGGNIRMFATSHCWVRNVESDHSSGASIAFDGSFRCELRDSILHTTVNPTPGGAGYGLEVDRYSADCLIENNISWNFNKVMVMRSSGGGNVIGYNYMQDGYGSYYPNIVENGLNASHMTTPHMELFEGNESFNFSGDPTWGNSIYITAFRNHLTGLRTAAAPLDTLTSSYVDGNGVQAVDFYEDEYNRRAIGLSKGHYWYNFVGNVLGFEGMTLLAEPRSFYKVPQTSFEYEASGNDNAVPMWSLGEGDPKVQATALRHGNFDFVTRDIVWDPANADHALPDSLYLSSKPAFFGATPWPIVTPENVSRPIAGDLPAKVRFQAFLQARHAPSGLVIRRSASGVEISWSGSDRLQSADHLGGPWTETVSQSNPQSIPATESRRFYRTQSR
jgi:hypothetical protein